MPTEAEEQEAQEKLAANEPCEFDETLNSIGATDKFIAEQLKGLIETTEEKAQIPKGANAFVYSKSMKALDINLKAVELTAKLKGLVPSEKVDHTGGIIVNIEATPIKKKKKED